MEKVVELGLESLVIALRAVDRLTLKAALEITLKINFSTLIAQHWKEN
jgi:hypothetical protein